MVEADIQAVEAVTQAEVAAGGPTRVRVDGKKIMEQIATRTGGRFFEAKKKDNLTEIYGQIAEELRGQYLLTYTPDQVDEDGGYHKIALKTNNGDYPSPRATATLRREEIRNSLQVCYKAVYADHFRFSLCSGHLQRLYCSKSQESGSLSDRSCDRKR